MPFCISCGKEIGSSQKFCQNCGARIEGEEIPKAPPAPAPSTLSQQPPAQPEPPVLTSSLPGKPFPPPPEPEKAHAPPLPPQPPVPPGDTKVRSGQFPKNRKIMVGAAAVLIVIAGIWFVVLPKLTGFPGSGPAGSAQSTTGAVQTTLSATPTVLVTTPEPTPAPEPFPDAYALKEWYTFSEGKTAAQGTIYLYWINETYQWHNDADNRWYTQHPTAGNKYLLVFANMVNRGDTRVWYPHPYSIRVHYGGQVYGVDTSHYIPDKSGGNLKATPIEVGEVQYHHDLFNTEYVEDYGMSHGTLSDFVYPGESNAIDGYLIYEVPLSLTPEKTYVEISFDGDSRKVWKLA